MSADPYSDAVRERFRAPAHAGTVEGGAEGRAATPDARVRLTAAMSDGRLGEVRFQAWGCPHLIAACDACAAALEGRPAADLLNYEVRCLMQTLAVPVEKAGRILVLEDAVRSLGRALSPRPDTQD